MNVWAVTMASSAVVIFVGVMVIARITFRPYRARNVKYAEAVNADAVHQRIIHAHIAYPEIVKGDRLDWHPYFLLPHIGVFAYACCLFGGAKLTSNVASLGDGTRYTMATCFLIGAGMVLFSSTLGARVGRWRICRNVHSHLTAEVLGDDIVMPYRISIAGQFAVAASMLIYSSTSFRNTTGSLGGWLTAMLALACIALAPMMYMRTRRFQKWETALIADALAEQEHDGS